VDLEMAILSTDEEEGLSEAKEEGRPFSQVVGSSLAFLSVTFIVR